MKVFLSDNISFRDNARRRKFMRFLKKDLRSNGDFSRSLYLLKLGVIPVSLYGLGK